jgi:DNA-binding transcriptional LysR family regulator
MIANFERLWALEQVSRLGSVTAAAAALSISQPALSRKLTVLAEELGFALMMRRGRHVLLTERAVALLATVRPAFAALDASWAKQAGPGRSLRVRVGIVESMAVYLLPRLLVQLQQHLPDAELRFQIAPSAEVESMTRDGRLDCGLSIAQRLRKDLAQIELYRDSFALFAPGAASRGGVMQLIVFPLRDRRMMKQVAAQIDAQRIPYSSRVEVSSFEVARVLIRGAYGYGYLPERVASEDVHHGLLRRLGTPFGEHLAVFSSHRTFLRAHRDVVRRLAALVSTIARTP